MALSADGLATALIPLVTSGLSDIEVVAKATPAFDLRLSEPTIDLGSEAVTLSASYRVQEGTRPNNYNNERKHCDTRHTFLKMARDSCRVGPAGSLMFVEVTHRNIASRAMLRIET